MEMNTFLSTHRPTAGAEEADLTRRWPRWDDRGVNADALMGFDDVLEGGVPIPGIGSTCLTHSG